MIMTLSMKKIVESRSRRGGPSLHRNLLVAGVLFKARDALLAKSAAVAAADDTLEKSSAIDESVADVDVDRTSIDDDEMECERTVAETETTSLSSSSSSPSSDVCSRLSGKENVPPSVVAPDQPRLCPDDSQPSADKSRAVKRQSRDLVDDDVTPCKTTRTDTSVEPTDHHRGLTERGVSKLTADDDDDDSDVACRTVNDDVSRQQTCLSSMSVSPSPSYLPAVASYVVRRSNTVSRLPCLDSRLTPNVADPPLVRPLLVVQVV